MFSPPIELLKQRYTERGNGDCWTTCIASITGKPRDQLELYHRAYMAWGSAYQREQQGEAALRFRLYEQAVLILAKHGLATIEIGGAFGLPTPTGLSIANGPGYRGVNHSCVAYDGEIVHDPHPSGEGLLSITSFSLVIPIERFTADEDCPLTRGLKPVHIESFWRAQFPDTKDLWIRCEACGAAVLKSQRNVHDRKRCIAGKGSA